MKEKKDKKRELINSYVLDRKRIRSIASKCNLDYKTVYYLLKTSGVRLQKRGRPRKESDRNVNGEEKWNPAILYFLYVILDLNQKELAQIYYCSKHWISKILKRYRIIKRGKNARNNSSYSMDNIIC